MRPFRFRAEAALQLRRREHDQALAHLARAQAALTAAERRVEEADAAIRDAEGQLATALQTAAQQVRLDWYRSWRVRWRVERDERERQSHLRQAEVHGASRRVALTHRRVRSLERLHECALSAWQQAVDAEERKTIDALATTRYTRRKEAV